MKNNSSKTLVGSLVLILEALSNKAVGLISTVILARVLVPEDFGIVAIAVLLLGIVDVLGNIGGMQYLLKKDKIDDTDLNAYFTLNFTLKSILSILFFFSSYTAAYYFDDERLIAIIQALSFLVFIRACGNPAEAYLRREHQYGGIVKVNILAKIISVALAVTIALIYKSYWALILGQIAQGSISIFGLYILKPFRPYFDFSKIKEQWEFSSWLIPQSVFGYLRTQLDTFLVSANFGKDTLGSYHVLKYLCYIPISNIIIPAIQPLTVELAKVKNNKEEFKKQYLITLLATMFLAIPITTLMFTYNDLVISVLLGDKWSEFSDMLGILAFLIPATVLLHQANRAIIVGGSTKLLFQYEIISFAFIYSFLYMVIGFENILNFTTARVKLEFLSTFILFSFVTIYFLCIKTYFKALISNSIMVAISFVSVKISQYIMVVFDGGILKLGYATLTYSAIYILITIIVSLFIKNHLEDWAEIAKIISKLKSRITTC